MRTKRKIFLITTVVAISLVAAAVVCVIRWQAWFGNLPEEKYEVDVVPNNIVLTLGEQAGNARIFSFRADTVIKEASVEIVDSSFVDTLCLPAIGNIVSSRSGKAAYYRAKVDYLTEGKYFYRCLTADTCSAWLPFEIKDKSEQEKFLVFGDVQSKGSETTVEMFSQAFARHDSALTAMMFVGDMIERPTDLYWQVLFFALQDKQAQIPIIAAAGNHEYLKGVIKHLDSRWKHVFGNPENGPQRFCGTTYFIDFPHCRIIVLDTDALNIMSDYTIMQTWLRIVLTDRDDAWKIVVMHHPVYSAGKGRYNPLIYATFANVLKSADVVFCGHDHNYMRKTGNGGKPVYVLTNSSEKYYAPRDTISADCHFAYQRFYEEIKVYTDSLRINTWQVANDTISDSLVLCKN